jgi:tRNA pseudouridine32 synthase/23S rRNA pseudouridine746 synthase
MDFSCIYGIFIVPLPAIMVSPFTLPPDPEAQEAAGEVIKKVHAYMRMHPESELHSCGKMFGVLVVKPSASGSQDLDRYLAAFSAKLDGSYYHDGFVPPVYEMQAEPIGHSKEESRRLQRLLFAQYSFLNGKGEAKNLLEIFQNEKPIIPAEEWFNKSPITNHQSPMPPSGSGECCAPKLLQYALAHGLEPLSMAEFWVGAPSKTEIRQEGVFYAPCSGKCVPILRHMLEGLSVLSPQSSVSAFQIETLYEDEWLMVVNKPAGLLSVPGKGEEPSVESLTGAKAVHRLDQDTSGLLVLAKDPEVYKALQSYFQRRDILKRYEAILQPNQTSNITNHQFPITNYQSEGQINLPLLPDPYDRPRQMVNPEHGKPAITRYVIREQRPDGTLLVDFYPLTGRTHQLRVHAAHPDGLNAPIVGDRLYNSQMSNYQSPVPRRLMLHAAEIRFIHPITQQQMHFCLTTNFL